MKINVYYFISPEEMGVNFKIVFHWHGDEPNYFPTVPIHCTYMCHSKHNKLLILVNVQFVAKVVSSVWNGVHLSCCGCPAGMLVSRINSSK